jgi:hypothetical protein
MDLGLSVEQRKHARPSRWIDHERPFRRPEAHKIDCGGMFDRSVGELSPEIAADTRTDDDFAVYAI